MFKINEPVKITVTLKKPDFDEACAEAYERALMVFGIGEFGHAEKVEGWTRSHCWFEVKFNDYVHTGSTGGQKFIYTFTAMAKMAD